MFIVLLEGEGGMSSGCDYTIGCNRNWMKLKATTIVEAHAEVDKLCGDYMLDISLAEILDVSDIVSFDIYASRQRITNKRNKEKKDLMKEARRSEYDRLKKEFGD